MKRQLQSSKAGILLAFAGLLMAGVGMHRGEMSTVFEKAVKICMECIGIG